MDLSHRLPYPEYDSFFGIFSDPSANEFYRDIISNNIKKISNALARLTKMIPQFNEFEIFVSFIAARYSLFNNSPKIRRDALHLLIAISETFMGENIIPYFLLLVHDENQNIKSEASTSLAATTKKCGGLKKNKQIVISAIGSMGAKAFSDNKSNLPEDILGRSRIASCAVLSATQILSLLKQDLTQKEIIELLQYIKKATASLVQALHELDVSSNETLFFNGRLRSCMYRLYQETYTIPRSPRPSIDDLLNETDEQCLKFVNPLMELLLKEKPASWTELLDNENLLNANYDEFLKHNDNATINKSLSLKLTPENMKKCANYLLSQSYQYINTYPFSQNPAIWDSLPEQFLQTVIQQTKPVQAKYVPKFKKYFTDVNAIEFSEESQDDEIADALISIAKTSDIPTIQEKWPQCIAKCIRKWKISPKTDWWSPFIENKLKELAENDAGAIDMCVPQEMKTTYHSLIADIILERLDKNNDGSTVTSEMWELTELTNSLISRIIELNPNVTVEPVRKQKIYTIVYQTIQQTKDESEAGELIGKFSLSSNTSLEQFPDSYEFLSHFFKVVAIDNVPESVELQFLYDYFRVSYPDFELHVYLKTFDDSHLDSNIQAFVRKLTIEKRQTLLNKAIEMEFLDSAIILLITNKGNAKLDIPYYEPLTPFLYAMNIDIPWKNEQFTKIFTEKEAESNMEEINKSANILIWYATLYTASEEQLNKIEQHFFPCTNSLNFHIFLVGLLKSKITAGQSRDHLLNAMQSLELLPQLDNATIQVLTQLFVHVAKLSSDDIIAFSTSISSYLSTPHSPSILQCLKGSIHSYLDKIPKEEWATLRDALSLGPVSGAVEFDNEVASNRMTDNDLYLFRAFPSAAAKYYHSIQNQQAHRDRLRLSLQKLSNEMKKEIIDKCLSTHIEGVEISSPEENVIFAESVSTDDPFTLRVVLPKEYPLLNPIFDVSSLGKEKITLDTRDEVKRECLRRDGIIASISTWAARISAVVSKVEVCPICLSLLDQHRSLPKMKCATCHKVFHATCIEMWLKNSLKKNCPCCRARWKRLK